MDQSGSKWKDATLNLALRNIVQDEAYRKKNGELNINQLSSLLGIDDKTIKSKLRI